MIFHVGTAVAEGSGFGAWGLLWGFRAFGFLGI